MLISCKCLNVTGLSNSAEEQVLKRTGSEQSRDLLNCEDIQAHEGLAEFLYIFRDFVKTTVGPIQDLTETVLHTDLVYEVPLKHLSVKYCINCKTITHMKNINTSEIWINSKLLTTSEKLAALKESKSFSKAFGIVMKTASSDSKSDSSSSSSSNITTASGNSSSMPTTPTSTTAPNLTAINNTYSTIPQNLNNKSNNQQAYIKKLTQHLDEQLQREYNEINEKISRYIEQQAAILESNREKAKQEYQILVSLINRVPDELKVINNNCNMTTNEDLTITPKANKIANETNKTGIISSISTTANGGAAGDNGNATLFSQKQPPQPLSSLDTPPATPDSTPMSVGNSPTFRQQTSIFGNHSSMMMGRNSITSLGMNDFNNGDTDCLFELDGMEETYPVSVSQNTMSDVEETEDAEDALGELEGMQIPRNVSRRPSSSIARSLPISIANASNPKFVVNDLDVELPEDRNVDIAASIKALAKSVHGDTVFGDLPRPRFSTQI